MFQKELLSSFQQGLLRQTAIDLKPFEQNVKSLLKIHVGLDSVAYSKPNTF